jgi:hypothetical protein
MPDLVLSSSQQLEIVRLTDLYAKFFKRVVQAVANTHANIGAGVNAVDIATFQKDIYFSVLQYFDKKFFINNPLYWLSPFVVENVIFNPANITAAHDDDYFTVKTNDDVDRDIRGFIHPQLTAQINLDAHAVAPQDKESIQNIFKLFKNLVKDLITKDLYNVLLPDLLKNIDPLITAYASKRVTIITSTTLDIEKSKTLAALQKVIVNVRDALFDIIERGTALPFVPTGVAVIDAPLADILAFPSTISELTNRVEELVNKQINQTTPDLPLNGFSFDAGELKIVQQLIHDAIFTSFKDACSAVGSIVDKKIKYKLASKVERSIDRVDAAKFKNTPAVREVDQVQRHVDELHTSLSQALPQPRGVFAAEKESLNIGEVGNKVSTLLQVFVKNKGKDVFSTDQVIQLKQDIATGIPAIQHLIETRGAGVTRNTIITAVSTLAVAVFTALLQASQQGFSGTTAGIGIALAVAGALVTAVKKISDDKTPGDAAEVKNNIEALNAQVDKQLALKQTRSELEGIASISGLANNYSALYKNKPETVTSATDKITSALYPRSVVIGMSPEAQ